MGTSWSETIVTDQTLARQIHRQELCTAINNDISARGGTPYVWTDTPGPAQVDNAPWRKTHIDQLRAACAYCWSLITPCSTNTVPAPVWASGAINADQQLIRKLHVDELRNYTNSCEDTCHCDCASHCSCVSHTHCSCAGMAHCCCEGHGC